MENFALNLPLNNLSFGVCSIAILREIYVRGLKPCIFPIGNPDLSSQEIIPEFGNWIQECINKAYTEHKRSNPTIKLWHLNGGLESFSDRNILITFYELDSPTKAEINVVKNNDKVLVTSNYTKEVFNKSGCNNVEYIELGFDNCNFKKIDKKPYDDGRIVFTCVGKAEISRKGTLKTIAAWVKKFGNNKDYILHCLNFNPFLGRNNDEILQNNLNLIRQARGGAFNVLAYQWLPTNVLYNEVLNTADIVLGVSGGEGFDFPVFHSVGLGKHSVNLNAHAYKDYLNDKNSVLIEPLAQKRDSKDGVFFNGGPFNNGSFFDWSEEDFNKGCDLAIERFKQNPINIEGLKLKDRTWTKTVDQILSYI